IEANGGVIRGNVTGDRVLVHSDAATGVRTAAGEEVGSTRAVIAATNADQLYLQLLQATPVVPPLLRAQAGRYRYGLGCMQIHLALSESAQFVDERLNRAGQPHLTAGLDGVSRAVNEATRGLL